MDIQHYWVPVIVHADDVAAIIGVYMVRMYNCVYYLRKLYTYNHMEKSNKFIICSIAYIETMTSVNVSHVARNLEKRSKALVV